MRAIVIHEAKDLRVEDHDAGKPGPGEVRVRLAVGGVCGSDLHYYNHGGFGPVRLKEPMILGRGRCALHQSTRGAARQDTDTRTGLERLLRRAREAPALHHRHDITATTSVYSVVLNREGVQRP